MTAFPGSRETILACFRNGLADGRLRVAAEVFRVVFFFIYSQICRRLRQLATPEGNENAPACAEAVSLRGARGITPL